MNKFLRGLSDGVFRWNRGNRDTGYRLLNVCEVFLGELGVKVLVGRYPEGSSQPPHTDQVSDHNLYRVALTLKKAKKGGEWVAPWANLKIGDRVLVFDPSTKHELTEIEEGTRWSVLVTFFTPKTKTEIEEAYLERKRKIAEEFVKKAKEKKHASE
jgi:hypothetical protein